MIKGIEFKTLFSLTEISEKLMKLPSVKDWRGGDSYYMGTHFDVEFENGVKIKIYDTATADYIGENPEVNQESFEERRNRMGYEMDIEVPEGEDDHLIQAVLDAIDAYEVKKS